MLRKSSVYIRKRNVNSLRFDYTAFLSLKGSVMRIGVPKEIKVHEYRVGLTPASVLELTNQGHEVVVECGAGTGIGFDDAQFVDVGATIGRVEEVLFLEAGGFR